MVSRPTLCSRHCISDTNPRSQVTWTGPADETNPQNWTYSKKWTITFVVSTYTFISAMSSSTMAPALDHIGNDLHVQSSFALFMTQSIFVLAYAFGPFLAGPLSEVYGRVIVLQLGNLVYMVFNTACGFAMTTGQLLAFRFLAGFGGR